jgi:predicted ATPase
MDGKRFLHSIRLQNVLSFGEEGVEIELQPLNVLIGPNGSGKSNLIEAIGILAAAPNDITLPFRSDGVSEWIWKGTKDYPTANIYAKFVTNTLSKDELVEHDLSFGLIGLGFQLVQEILLKNHLDDKSNKRSEILYKSQNGEIQILKSEQFSALELGLKNLEPRSGNKSLFSMPFSQLIPEIRDIKDNLSKTKIYRNMDVSRNSPLRRPQSVDNVGDFLSEDGGNLSTVIIDLQRDYEIRQNLLQLFQEFYEPAREVAFEIVGNLIRVIIHEKGLSKSTPISRLSDGTIRYLCLLTILCHPNPPPLVCIEEPELGLHPDIIPTIAKLLIEASQRTQLIITTHSDILISALDKVPEAVIVCEKNKYGTSLERLDPKEMNIWMEKYSLGNLWRRGQLGGNRW